MDSTATVGTSMLFSRQDHIHPSDTSRAALASPIFTGDPKAPTPTAGDNDTSIATTAFVTAAVAGAVRYATLIINGDFRVNQVGYVSAAALSVGTYGHDQWKAGASGGDYSFTQLKSSTQITIASGKSLIQPIEDVNVVGGSYVLSWTGTAQARAGVNTLTPSGSYAASPLLITGQTAGTVMSVEFNNGTLGTVKLESGASATPFVMRPYDQELVTCQRYFNRVGVSIQFRSIGGGVAGTVTVNFPYMRASPAASTTTIGTQTNLASRGFFGITPNGLGYQIVGATGAAAPGTETYELGSIITLDARL
jgi:hypothetical protein